MAERLNGQQFRFNGYLPIDNAEKIKAVKQLEQQSAKTIAQNYLLKHHTVITQMLETIIKNCQPQYIIKYCCGYYF